MKALVKKNAGPGLWLEDVPEPEIGINDVLIQIDRTGICGTDVHIYKWDDWARKTIPVPLVIGHEFVGEVVSSSQRDLVGQRVCGEINIVCGTHQKHRLPDSRVSEGDRLVQLDDG